MGAATIVNNQQSAIVWKPILCPRCGEDVVLSTFANGNFTYWCLNKHTWEYGDTEARDCKSLPHLCIACGLEHEGCCGSCEYYVPIEPKKAA